MIAPAVKTAVPLDPYVVRAVFAGGEVRDVDIEFAETVVVAERRRP